MQTKLTSDRETKLIHSLHDILRPFLLRRMKADVEMALPPKKEYVLYTPLSEPQRALYDVVVQGDRALRQHLIDEIRAEEERLNGGGRKVSDDEEERPAGLEWERSVAQSVLPAPPPASCAHCSQNEFASLSFACGEFPLAALYRSFRTHIYCVRSLYAQLLIRAALTGID